MRSAAVRLEAIVPKRLPVYDEKLFDEAIKKGLKAAAAEIKADFEKTTRTWRKKPRFFSRSSYRGSSATVAVGTSDQTYQYVSFGTRPHYITPRRAKWLRYPKSFRSKTTPGSISSRAGYSGSRMLYAKEILHPGVEPRFFEIYIAERHERRRTVSRRVQEEINRAVRRSSRG